MSVKDLENFLHLTVNDAMFREKLASDPAAALTSKGIEATPDRVQALKALSFPQLQNLATAFGHPDVKGIQ